MSNDERSPFEVLRVAPTLDAERIRAAYEAAGEGGGAPGDELRAALEALLEPERRAAAYLSAPPSLPGELAALDDGLGQRLLREGQAERERLLAEQQRRALVDALSSMSLAEARRRFGG
jgi:hypothetical protein